MNVVVPPGAGVRYLFVGLTCAALHNAILIGLDRFSVPYLVSSAVSYGVVVSVGYVLHTALTFRTPRTPSTFARYAVAMAANYPLIVALLFLMVTIGGLPIPIASPVGTLILFGWNFVASRWAVVRPRGGRSSSGLAPHETTPDVVVPAAGMARSPAIPIDPLLPDDDR